MTAPFEIVQQELANGTPIRFKHDEESRAELKKIRTTEELVLLAKGYDLFDYLLFTTFNNNINFECIPFEGELVKKDNKILINSDEKTLGEIIHDEVQNHEIEEILNTPPERLEVSLICFQNKFDILFNIFDTPEEKNNFYFSGEYDVSVVKQLLKVTETNSLQKLGKLINKLSNCDK